MRNLYFGLVHKTRASTSLEARKYLFDWLNEHWFTWEDFYFWWKWDRFVIGWIWNWILQKLIDWKEHYDKDAVDKSYWTEYDAMEWTNELLNKLKEKYYRKTDIELSDEYIKMFTDFGTIKHWKNDENY